MMMMWLRRWLKRMKMMLLLLLATWLRPLFQGWVLLPPGFLLAYLRVNTPMLSMLLILGLLNISFYLGSGGLRLLLGSRCPRGDVRLINTLQHVIFS